MAHYQILYWYDIPLQVRSREGRERANVSLPPRFQEAIDAAAMAARLTGVDHPGTPAEVVAAVAAELDQQYPVIDWRKTAAGLKRNE